jgi:hypothetical protein
MYMYNDRSSTNGAWNSNAMARDELWCMLLNF